jgi:hypothetical protein
MIRGRSLVAKYAPIFSHYSAARVWELPIFGRWPTEVHIEVGVKRNGRSIEGLRRHRSGGVIASELHSEMRITTLARTVVDLAMVGSLRTAVVIADAALTGLRDGYGNWSRAPISREELLEELEQRGPVRGSQQAAWALGFGDARSGSPGESVSRLTMFEIGCPPPELQATFRDHGGMFVATTDFWWPDYNLTGEFDGRGKYLREVYLGGRTPGQAVVDEKIREDAVRALGPGMCRWVWEEATSARALRLKLSRAGLPCLK